MNFVLIFFILLFPATSLAGAWINKTGESTLINNFTAMHFNQFVDSNGVMQDRPDFLKLEYKPYYEYGLSENYGIGFSPSFQRVTGEYLAAFESGIDSNEAFTGADIFLKRKLYQSDKYHYVVSFIPMIELPGIYKEEKTPSFGKQESFWNAIVSLGFNTYSISGQYDYTNYGYVNIEGGVRSRFSDSFTDESGSSFKASAIASLPVTQKHSLNIGLDYTKSLAGYSTGALAFLNRYGYDSTQLSVTDYYKLRWFDIEYGYIYQFDAKNGGIGNGLKFSIWHKF
jgi:hypothetical protein